VRALGWALGPWLGWVPGWLREIVGPLRHATTLGSLAVCLAVAAPVAVFGARRPGVAAWNLVVLGLLAVLLLPVAEGLGRPRLSWPHAVFLSGTLLIAILNYLPTRLAPAALLLGAGGALEIPRLFAAAAGLDSFRQAAAVGAPLALALSPWLAYAQFRRRVLPPVEFDRLWLGFRDRFGVVWSQRLREQFNRAAANAGWPVVLRWQGLRLRPGSPIPEAEVQAEIVATLRSMLKRFGAAEAGGEGEGAG